MRRILAAGSLLLAGAAASIAQTPEVEAVQQARLELQRTEREILAAQYQIAQAQPEVQELERRRQDLQREQEILARSYQIAQAQPAQPNMQEVERRRQQLQQQQQELEQARAQLAQAQAGQPNAQEIQRQRRELQRRQQELRRAQQQLQQAERGLQRARAQAARPAVAARPNAVPRAAGIIGGQQGPALERALGVPGGRWWTRPEMAERLGITADQQKKMDDIFQQHRLKLIDAEASLRKEEAIMEPLVSAEQPDEGKIVSQIDKVAQARAELEKNNARMLLGIRRLLTPDQWNKLKAQPMVTRSFTPPPPPRVAPAPGPAPQPAQPPSPPLPNQKRM